MSVEEMLAEDHKMVRYGNRQAKTFGIKSKEVNRVIHASGPQRQTIRSFPAIATCAG